MTRRSTYAQLGVNNDARPPEDLVDSGPQHGCLPSVPRLPACQQATYPYHVSDNRNWDWIWLRRSVIRACLPWCQAQVVIRILLPSSSPTPKHRNQSSSSSSSSSVRPHLDPLARSFPRENPLLCNLPLRTVARLVECSIRDGPFCGSISSSCERIGPRLHPPTRVSGRQDEIKEEIKQKQCKQRLPSLPSGPANNSAQARHLDGPYNPSSIPSHLLLGQTLLGGTVPHPWHKPDDRDGLNHGTRQGIQ